MLTHYFNPTSASSERVFSVAGRVIEKRRNRLSGKNSEDLIFLHESWDVAYEYLDDGGVVDDDDLNDGGGVGLGGGGRTTMSRVLGEGIYRNKDNRIKGYITSVELNCSS